MGLPLFVAKVESDVPQKCPHKAQHASTSPPRTNIRRVPRANRIRHVQDPAGRFRRVLAHEQDQRSINGVADLRRIIALEQSQRSISGTADLTSPYRDSDLRVPELPSHHQPVSRRAVASHVSSRFRSVPRDFFEDRRRLVNWFDSTFGRDWHDRDWESAQRDTAGNHWNIEEPTVNSYARLVRIIASPYLTSTRDRGTSVNLVPAETWPVVNTPYHLRNRRTESPYSSSQHLPSRAARESIRERARQRLSQRVSRETLPNGLGDRIHSPSPEAWDTLLSTLTPDPQPPSANSSFASTAATQSAGVSTNTSLSERHTDSLIPDGPCDSANEDSDDAEEASRNRLRRFQSGGPRVRHRLVVPGGRSPLDAVESYMRQHIAAPGENFTLMFGISDADTPGDSPEDLDGGWSEPFPDGTLPSYRSFVQATRPDGPDSDATEYQPRAPGPRVRWPRRLPDDLESSDRLMVRLENDEDVPDELWATSGIRPSWERGDRF